MQTLNLVLAIACGVLAVSAAMNRDWLWAGLLGLCAVANTIAFLNPSY